jgi:hypothetical protein
MGIFDIFKKNKEDEIPPSGEIPTIFMSKEMEPQTPTPIPEVEVTREDVIQQCIKHGERIGHKFDTPEEARKWGERYLEKGMEKYRKKGLPVCCTVCGKAISNAKTGPLIKNLDGSLKHRNC